MQQTALQACKISRNNMARKADYLHDEDLEVFVDMIENGNFDKEEFTNEYCEIINTVRLGFYQLYSSIFIDKNK